MYRHKNKKGNNCKGIILSDYICKIILQPVTSKRERNNTPIICTRSLRNKKNIQQLLNNFTNDLFLCPYIFLNKFYGSIRIEILTFESG